MLSKPRTTKGPVTWMSAESCFDWIVLDVAQRIKEMLLISNHPIVRLWHPKQVAKPHGVA